MDADRNVLTQLRGSTVMFYVSQKSRGNSISVFPAQRTKEIRLTPGI